MMAAFPLTTAKASTCENEARATAGAGSLHCVQLEQFEPLAPMYSVAHVVRSALQAAKTPLKNDAAVRLCVCDRRHAETLLRGFISAFTGKVEHNSEV